jgi:pimeloyl-ACP methyl ester carboxylesterase
VAQSGYAAFTFDFRGYGESGGQRTFNLIDRDVRGAIDYLRGQGFSRIVLIGASMGAVACAKNAHEANVTGLGLVSSPRAFEGIEVAGNDLTGLDIPKLFLAAEDDEPAVTDTRTMHSWASSPKEIVLFSGNAHGTNLFDTDHKAELESALLDLIRTASGDG